MDPDRFPLFLIGDATFRFGNSQPVNGKQNVRDAAAAFFSRIKGIDHKLLGKWQVDDIVSARMPSVFTTR